jgi:hypothetical protein
MVSISRTGLTTNRVDHECRKKQGNSTAKIAKYKGTHAVPLPPDDFNIS